MKPVALTLFLFAAIIMAAGCATPETVTTNNQPLVVASPATKAVATPDELAVASGIFQKDCAGCHGTDGSGGMKVIDAQKLNVPSLREGHALKHSDEEFVRQIAEGGDGMPAFQDKISPNDINNLVRFIRKEFQAR